MTCDQIWYLHDGTVAVTDGGFEEYKKMLLKKMSEDNKAIISL